MQKRLEYKSIIDDIVDNLSKKKIGIFDTIPENKITVFNQDNFKLKAIEIYNRNNVDSFIKEIFYKEYKLLEHINDINRAIYICLDIKSSIPTHIDDDDNSYRILTAVIVDKSTFQIKDSTFSMSDKKSIGFFANKQSHSLMNLGNSKSSFLIICLDNDPLETDEMVEIIL